VRELVGDGGDAIASFLVEIFNDSSQKTGDRLEAAASCLIEAGAVLPAIDAGDSPAKWVLVSAFGVASEEAG
jgi:hypothetical protein